MILFNYLVLELHKALVSPRRMGSSFQLRNKKKIIQSLRIRFLAFWTAQKSGWAGRLFCGSRLTDTSRLNLA